jgi:hypothetical protein
VTAGPARHVFPFNAPCNAVDDLVPGWVNPVFALAAVVCIAAGAMAYLVWADPGGVMSRVVAPMGAALARVLRQPRLAAVVTTLAVVGSVGVVLGYLLFYLAFVLHLSDGGTLGGMGAAATPGETSLLSRVLLYGAIGLVVLVEVMIGRAAYRSVLESARRRR